MAEEFVHLTEACGHHCGAHMAGKNKIVRHCECHECHGPVSSIISEGVNNHDLGTN